MSHVYTVYSHSKEGDWGFSALTGAGKVKTAFIAQETRAVTVKDLEPLMVAPAIQKLLRKGYTKVQKPKYLHVQLETGEFVDKHPDLGQHLGFGCVLFAGAPAQTDMNALVDEWADQLDGTSDASALRDAWLRHCRTVTTYVPAVDNGDVYAALLVAQWARDNNLVLMASKGTLPLKSPKTQRYEWREFLQEWFNRNCIDRALTELGWPLAGALCAPEATPSTKPDDAGWLAVAQQAAF